MKSFTICTEFVNQSLMHQELAHMDCAAYAVKPLEPDNHIAYVWHFLRGMNPMTNSRNCTCQQSSVNRLDQHNISVKTGCFAQLLGICISCTYMYCYACWRLCVINAL